MKKRYRSCEQCGKKVAATGMYLHHTRKHPDIPWIKKEDRARPEPLGTTPEGDLLENPAVAQGVQPLPSPMLELPPELEAKPRARAAPAKQAKPSPPASLSGMAFGALATVRPYQFSIETALMFQAKHITEHEWGWPELPPGQWLDIFLHRVMRDYGWLIGGYVRVDADGVPVTVESPRNGHNGSQAEEPDEEEPDDESSEGPIFDSEQAEVEVSDGVAAA